MDLDLLSMDGGAAAGPPVDDDISMIARCFKFTREDAELLD